MGIQIGYSGKSKENSATSMVKKVIKEFKVRELVEQGIQGETARPLVLQVDHLELQGYPRG